MTIQTLVRIETPFNNQVIELLQVGSEFHIDSRQVAPNIGIEHKHFIETLRIYQTELEYFGSLRFETAVRKREIGATHQTYVMLNRNQVLFAITLSRNTEQVVQWKMALIDALDQLEKRLHTPTTNRRTTLLKAPLRAEEEQERIKQGILAYLQAHPEEWFETRGIQRNRNVKTACEAREALISLFENGAILQDRKPGKSGKLITFYTVK